MKRRHHQGYSARLDESLGERHRGHHKQSLEARRHESEAMERHYGHGEFHGVEGMDHAARKKHRHHMAATHHKWMAEHHRKKAGHRYHQTAADRRHEAEALRRAMRGR
jgi:hypothetical protein